MDWLLMLVWVLFRIVREDKLFFSEEVWYREFIFLKVLGEFKLGRIFFLSLLLYMLLLVSVVFVFNVVFDNDENELFFWVLWNLLSRVMEIEFLEFIGEIVLEGEGNFWWFFEDLWFDWYWYLKCIFSFLVDFFFFWILIILLCIEFCFDVVLFLLFVDIEFFI